MWRARVSIKSCLCCSVEVKNRCYYLCFKPGINLLFRTPEERPPAISGQVGKPMHLGLPGAPDERAIFGISGVIGSKLVCVLERVLCVHACGARAAKDLEEVTLPES